MTFDEVLDQVRELVRTRGRVSYQSLKVRFTITDQFLEGVKAELYRIKRELTLQQQYPSEMRPH